MLTFSLNEEYFALDLNASARLNWKNPACNTKDFPGDLGLGIEIPVNDINRSILGNPERFERYSKTNIREFSRFEVRFGGVLLMGGTLVVQNADNKLYECWLRSDLGNLGKEHREKYITDSISFSQNRTFENKGNYDPLVDDYGCPRIFNPNFFDEKSEKTVIPIMVPNPNYKKWVLVGFNSWKRDDREFIMEGSSEVEDFTEAYRRTAGWFVNATHPGGQIITGVAKSKGNAKSIATELNVSVVSPMLFLNYILKTIIRDSGFAIANNFIADDPDLQKLILYNNFDITQIKFYHSLWGFLSYYREYDPWYDIASGYAVESIRRDVDGYFQYKDLVPKIQLKDWIISVQNLLNVFFHFRPGRKLIDIIDREQILTSEAVDIEEYLTGHWLMGEEKDVTLKFTFDHDKNDVLFSERWTDIDEFRDNEKPSVKTWANLPSNGDMDEIRLVRDLNKYAQYKLWVYEEEDPDTGNTVQKKYIGWRQLTIGFQNGYFNYGRAEEEEIATKFSTLDFRTQSEEIPEDPLTDIGDTTITYQKGNIRTEFFAFENFTPRLLFYTGNNRAAYETDNISLDWEKENGLLEKRWKWWARFWSRRQPVQCEAHFPLNVLSDVVANIYKKYRTREGEFIIEEMETEFGLNQISTTKIKGYKINYGTETYKLTDVWKLGDSFDFNFEILIELGWWQGNPESSNMFN